MKKTIAVFFAMIATAILATTNEITSTIDFRVSKNSVQVYKQYSSGTIQMVGTRFYSSVYTLTTTNQAMAKGAIAQPGWCYIRNLSTNLACNLTCDSGITTNLQLLSGEALLMRLSPTYDPTNITAAAASSTVDMEFTVIEK